MVWRGGHHCYGLSSQVVHGGVGGNLSHDSRRWGRSGYNSWCRVSRVTSNLGSVSMRESREPLHEGGGVNLAVNERDYLAEHLFPGLDSGANVEVDVVARVRVQRLCLILKQQDDYLTEEVELRSAGQVLPACIFSIRVSLQAIRGRQFNFSLSYIT